MYLLQKNQKRTPQKRTRRIFLEKRHWKMINHHQGMS